MLDACLGKKHPLRSRPTGSGLWRLKYKYCPGDPKYMILGEDPKHVSQLNVNLSLILSLCLSPILSLSLRLEARG